MIALNINGISHELNVDAEMPLLWAIRDVVGLTGSKYGCGKALCGACTVHMNGQPVRSCSVPVGAAAGAVITTIEGLDSDVGRVVRETWVKMQVPQCGFCQSGQIMSATALLERRSDPSDEDIDLAMQGNICRCATYVRIRAGIKEAARTLAGEAATDE
jgi:isoquinoline 1-oxidoreductase alpha subunit